MSENPVTAQTVIYDGSQQLNIFGAARLTDDAALTNVPGNDQRNGIINSGADPEALEQGDAAWFYSTLRNMRNTTLGSAGSAVGVDGTFMSSLVDETGATTSSTDREGHGAGYVLYDMGATTGMQNFNISLYYNDPTPNAPAPNTNLNSGGNVGFRIMGIRDTGDDSNPWGDDDFTYIAGGAFAGHFFSGGRHRANSDAGDQPVVDRLFLAESSLDETEDFNPDAILTPSDEWQDLSFQFDAGDGYDYLIFSVSGVVQDANTLGVDRFGFDNISFEAASSFPIGDFDMNGVVNLADLDQYIGNIDVPADGSLAALDLNGDGTVGADDFAEHYQTLVETSNGQVGTFGGDANLDGIVDVLGDAALLVNNLGNSVTSWGQGDFNGDGAVDVLGDAAILVQNLGNSNAGTSSAATSAVPEPATGLLLIVGGVLGCSVRRKKS